MKMKSEIEMMHKINKNKKNISVYGQVKKILKKTFI